MFHERRQHNIITILIGQNYVPSYIEYTKTSVVYPSDCDLKRLNSRGWKDCKKRLKREENFGRLCCKPAGQRWSRTRPHQFSDTERLSAGDVGFLLPEDAGRVREKVSSLISAGDAGGGN